MTAKAEATKEKLGKQNFTRTLVKREKGVKRENGRKYLQITYVIRD